MTVDFEAFCRDFDVALVIASRDRAATLAKYSDQHITGYHLFYSGEGYDEYQFNCISRHEVPRGIQGLSTVRNYILDVLPNRIVVFVDDDVQRILWIAGPESVRVDPQGVHLAIIDMVVHALDQDSTVFGMTGLDIRKTSPLNPFVLRAVIGTFIGVIGRDLRFDERNILKTDYDFCLMSLVKSRIIHMDMRYRVLSYKDAVAGGNMEFRTQQRREREVQNLIDWWGDDVIVPGKNKSNEKLTVKIP